MKVFITGGAGFIGSFVAKELVSNGDDVIIYDSFVNFTSPLKSHYQFYLKRRLDNISNKVTVVRGDIRHKGHLLRTLNEHKPDNVIHLAALPIATISNKFPEEATEINLYGTVNVLEAMREVGVVKRFIYASSSMIYGDFQYSPADENHPKNPKDVYGATKLAGEILTESFGKMYGIDYIIIRPSAVYGPTDANRRVSQIFVENALQGKPLVLHEGGNSKLDFSYVEDVAHGFVLALKSKVRNDVFNITRGEGKSIKEFAEILSKLVPNLRTVVKPADIVRPERGALDISKARKKLGYKPRYSLEEGLKKYVDFIKSVGVTKGSDNDKD